MSKLIALIDVVTREEFNGTRLDNIKLSMSFEELPEPVVGERVAGTRYATVTWSADSLSLRGLRKYMDETAAAYVFVEEAIPHGTEVHEGDVWTFGDGTTTWLVVGPEKNGMIPLSGPGPCRGMRHMNARDILVAGTLVRRVR